MSNDNKAEQQRRKALKSMLAGGAVAGSLPGQWVKPIVESVTLPAHASTTDPVATTPDPPEITGSFGASIPEPIAFEGNSVLDYFVSTANASSAPFDTCINLKGDTVNILHGHLPGCLLQGSGKLGDTILMNNRVLECPPRDCDKFMGATFRINSITGDAPNRVINLDYANAEEGGGFDGNYDCDEIPGPCEVPTCTE